MPHDPLGEPWPSFRLDGRLAIVTGSSAGIGRTIAQAYAAAGAEVVLVSRRTEQLLSVRHSLESQGGKAHVISADLAKLEEIGALESGVSRLIAGRDLDLVLVNCAG